MKITGGASNLINGVSRQAPDVRLTTQLQESLNQWPTVTRGLVKRNPSIRRGGLPALLSGTLIHLIDRDVSERYVVEIGNGSIRVWDLQGVAQTVNAPSGWGYVATASEDAYRAVTVADHTFILNNTVTVLKNTTRTPASRSQALIHIVQGSYHTTYTVKINGLRVAEVVMGGGPFGNDADARDIERFVKADNIAAVLVNGRIADGGIINDVPGKIQGVAQMVTDTDTGAGTLPATEWTVTRYNNVIHVLNRLGNDFTIEVSASDPNLIRAHKDVSPIYSELPRNAPNGFALKINGDADSNHDDYYVQFVKAAGTGAGRWKESHAPDTQVSLRPSTMPHVLIREADGTFTFRPATWETRKVGDDTSNPWPSFLGRKITGILYAQNRLGLFAGESVALSRHNSYFDFFKESLLSKLDTDPVDLTIAHPDVSTILQAVPMGDEIVLFTTSVQFRLSADGARLTSDNGSIKPILSARSKARAAPISLGSRLYFANNAPSGSFVTEFLYDRDGGMKADEDITAHVQGYLPSTVDYLCGDKDLRILALVGTAEPSTIYTYRWMLSGTERVQSAWQKWSIPSVTSVRAMRVMGEELFLICVVPGGAEILSINLHEGWRQGFQSPVYLDRSVTVSGGVYNSATNRTTFTVPYAGANFVFPVADAAFGRALAPTWASNGLSFWMQNDWTNTSFIVGITYDSWGTLSPLLYRSTNNQGSYGNAVAGVDTWVSSLAFSSSETAFLEVEVSRRYRPVYRKVLTPAEMGTLAGFVGGQHIGKLSQTVSVMARTDDVSIRFGSSTPHPYSVTGLSWNGNATPATL